jgi:hypothetical protein
MTDTEQLDTIAPGDFAFRMDCPECGRAVVAPVNLGAVLTVTDEAGYLRAKLSTKRVEHNCSGTDEAQPDLFEGNGAAPFDTAKA